MGIWYEEDISLCYNIDAILYILWPYDDIDGLYSSRFNHGQFED